ncbi:sensor histidine kinase [Kineococcus rhizosphaerae]|uniref:sensor histidine kinase n=1 Tax=Kineococcus rhizosphaerae TaxID=559628 RepID=UPI000D04DF04|nr:histidine kinase [Kineococcus rhizosphaerae]
MGTPLRWRERSPDIVVGLLTAGLGLAEVAVRTTWGGESGSVLFVLLVALTTAIARPLPAVALALVWLTGVAQFATGLPLLLTQLLLAYVAFAGARWGSRWVLALSGLSIPLGVLVGGVLLVYGQYSPGILVVQGLRDVLDRVGVSLLAGLPIALLTLAAAWLGGLALRFAGNAAVSRRARVEAEQESARAHRETAQAYEIARLRDEQTRMAHDVHDVVGHSLAVILAQAESGQFLPDADPTALKATLRTIAGTARSSLQDVQGVLSATPVPPGRLQALIDGAGSTGFTVRSHSSGPARPLPPELAAVAYRVLQEMLTNALKHGDRDVPVDVVQRWPAGPHEELELSVTNGIPVDGSPSGPGGGRGLDGMRRRLEAVGGWAQVAVDGARFSITASVPVRS